MIKTEDRIIDLRKTIGLTRQQFADRLKCTYRSIYFYETAQRLPSFRTCYRMAKLAQEYGITYITVDWIRPDL